MTKKERRSPKILDGKRKRRIAAGSGTKVEEVNRLIKMHRQMADMMKMMGKSKGMMQRMAGAMGLGGGLGGMMGGGGPSAAEIEQMQKELARLDPKALEQLPDEVKEQLDKVANPAAAKPAKPMPGLPGLPGLGGAKLPGLGGGLPGLGGRPPFPFSQGKKK
jgi:signal recognition particle subunit SRP54